MTDDGSHADSRDDETEPVERNDDDGSILKRITGFFNDLLSFDDE